jgi:nucleoside-diphosphate-sugar epimerase
VTRTPHRIFVAGASGAVGRPLCRLLVADGFQVVGTTRSAAKAPALAALGVEPVVVDVFDAAGLRHAVAAARPDVVVHQLTDLPTALDAARMAAALVRTARIRDEGTRNLMSAAVASGVTRVVAQSIAFSVTDALQAFEQQVLDAALEGLILRYGQFYGPGTGFDIPSAAPPTVHVEAAADAARRAVTRGSSGIYVVADDAEGVPTERARHELAWSAAFRIDPKTA